MRKKFLAGALALTMALGLVACGNNSSNENKTDNSTSATAEPEELTLEYTNKEALNLWDNEEDMPYFDEDVSGQSVTLTPYIAEDVSQAGCVIICPGGGYAHVATETEGIAPAEEFNKNGISAFVLEYRYSPYDYHAILSDVFRAIRFVRYYAEEFNIDPDKIAVMGFSAGGHLAAMSLEHFDEDTQDLDAIDKVSAEPNFGILCYPVLSLSSENTHEGSRDNFLGDEATDTELQKKYSAELGVTADTAPCFVWHSQNDSTVPYEGSQAFADAMTAAGAECEFHLYRWGGHGIGLALDNLADVKDWFPTCITWLNNHGY